MKKLFAIVAAFGMLVAYSGIALAIDDPDSRGVKLRSLMKGGRNSDPARVYLLVRNGDTRVNQGSLNSGDAVKWDTTSADGVTITTTTSSNDAVSGILVTTIQTGDAGASSAKDDDGRRNWGYMQIYGLTAASITAGGSNGAAVGDIVIPSGDTGVITTLSAQGPEATDATVKQAAKSGGIFIGTAADVADTTVEVFVNLL